MDQKDSIALPGSASFSMVQRGITESLSGTRREFQESQSVHPLSDASVDYKSNANRSTLPEDPSSGSVNVGGHAHVAVPPGQSGGRKRGRPRRYGPEEAALLGSTPSIAIHPGMTTHANKRARGQGGGRKHQSASFGDRITGSAGTGFTPHVITVATGDDVGMKIMSFAQQSRRVLCVISATGAVSSVALCLPSTGSFVRYEGRFEIICLSGSYLPTGDGESDNRSGGLTICVASHDGRVIGGILAGMLIALTPVQVILGSFSWGSSKMEHKRQGDDQSAKDSQQEIAEDCEVPAFATSSLHVSVNTSSGMWPSSQSLDMQNQRVGIDLMHG